MAILVVEPQAEYQQQIIEVVKWVDRRFRVEVASDGASAWELARQQKPHLILCEPLLPDIHGEVLCSRLRPYLKRTSFVAYSQSAKDARIEPGKLFDARLSKPPSRFDVLACIRNAKHDFLKHRDARVGSGEDG